MPTYDVDVQGTTYEVDAPDETTAWKWAVASHTQQQQPAEPEKGSILKEALAAAGPTIRGFGPVGAGMLAGAALGAPTGIGAVPLAAAGGAAAELTTLIGDPLIAGINRLTGSNMATPTEAWTALFDKLGVPRSETAAAKLVEAASRGLGGATGFIGAGRALAGSTSPIVAGVGEALAAEPAAQMVAGMTGGAGGEGARQVAESLGAGTKGQLAAGIVGSLVGGGAGATAASIPGRIRAGGIPEAVQAAERQGIQVLTSDVMPPKGPFGQMLRRAGESALGGTTARRVAQQSERVEAIDRLLTDYGIHNDVPLAPAVAEDLLGTRTATRDALVKQKLGVISDVDAATGNAPVQMKNTEQTVANLINALSSESPSGALNPLIKSIYEFGVDAVLADKNLAGIEQTRKRLGATLASPELSSVKDLASQAKDAIYAAVKQDMREHIQSSLGAEAVGQFENANLKLSNMMDELKSTVLKSALDKGDVKPEVINSLLFSKSPSEIELLHNNLSEAGRQNARAAILQKVAESSMDKTGQISPDRFTQNLFKAENSVSQFFQGPARDQLDGLVSALNISSRASKVGLERGTGYDLQSTLFNAMLGRAFGVVGAVTGNLGIGLAARVYESPTVRDILLRLPKLNPESQQAYSLVNKLARTMAAQNGELVAQAVSEAGRTLAFDPSTTKMEKFNGKDIETDTSTGFRLVQSAGNKYRLFSPEGGLEGVYDSPDSAKAAAVNKQRQRLKKPVPIQ